MLNMSKLKKEVDKKLEDNGISFLNLSVSFGTFTEVYSWWDQSNEYINHYIGKIKLIVDLDDEMGNQRAVEIGDFRCYYLDEFNPITNSFNDLREVADSFSGDLITAVKPITNNDGETLDCYVGIGSSILYIDRFYIKPEYREKGIGFAIFPLIIDILGRGAGVVTIIVSPTENNCEDRIKSDDVRYKSIYKRMTNFLKKYDFVEVNKEERVWAKSLA